MQTIKALVVTPPDISTSDYYLRGYGKRNVCRVNHRMLRDLQAAIREELARVSENKWAYMLMGTVSNKYSKGKSR